MCPLESDRASQYESSQSVIKKNTESIRQLRQENKTLFKKLTEANNVSPAVLLLFVLTYFQSKDHLDSIRKT